MAVVGVVGENDVIEHWNSVQFMKRRDFYTIYQLIVNRLIHFFFLLCITFYLQHNSISYRRCTKAQRNMDLDQVKNSVCQVFRRGSLLPVVPPGDLNTPPPGRIHDLGNV